jgi:flagellar motor switch protein FliN/FliY
MSMDGQGETQNGVPPADPAGEPAGSKPGSGWSTTPPPRVDPRLDAVLDVDLPLVVRFGRAVMPLRALADLGPGAVIDMGRSPEEPVELLVGDRVIARGEVVIVGGNYGVRISELAGDRPASAGLEARTS